MRRWGKGAEVVAEGAGDHRSPSLRLGRSRLRGRAVGREGRPISREVYKDTDDTSQWALSKQHSLSKKQRCFLTGSFLLSHILI